MQEFAWGERGERPASETDYNRAGAQHAQSPQSSELIPRTAVERT